MQNIQAVIYSEYKTVHEEALNYRKTQITCTIVSIGKEQ